MDSSEMELHSVSTTPGNTDNHMVCQYHVMVHGTVTFLSLDLVALSIYNDKGRS